MNQDEANQPRARYWAELPRDGRILFAGIALQFLGTGLVLPFHIVYLHDVLDVPLSQVGLLLGVSQLAGLVIVGPTGVAIDAFGARRALVAASLVQAAGAVVMALSSDAILAGVGLVMVGAATGIAWPTSQALLATVVPAAVRHRYFGVHFALVNLGIGLGGLVSGFFVDPSDPGTFRVVYLADAASYLPVLALLTIGPLRRLNPAITHGGTDESPPSYRKVIGTRAVIPLMVVVFTCGFFGHAQLQGGLVAYGTVVAGVSPDGLGVAFAANTATIVLLQLVVLRRIETVRRTRVLCALGGVWAAAWILLAGSGAASGTVAATFLLALCALVFGVGETMVQPVVPAIVNDLADEGSRGRFNSLSAGVHQASVVTALPVTGFLIDQGWYLQFNLLLIGGGLSISAAALFLLEPTLSSAANGEGLVEPPPNHRDG